MSGGARWQLSGRGLPGFRQPRFAPIGRDRPSIPLPQAVWNARYRHFVRFPSSWCKTAMVAADDRQTLDEIRPDGTNCDEPRGELAVGRPEIALSSHLADPTVDRCRERRARHPRLGRPPVRYKRRTAAPQAARARPPSLDMCVNCFSPNDETRGAARVDRVKLGGPCPVVKGRCSTSNLTHSVSLNDQ